MELLIVLIVVLAGSVIGGWSDERKWELEKANRKWANSDEGKAAAVAAQNDENPELAAWFKRVNGGN